MGAATGVAKDRLKEAEGYALRVRPLDRFRASLREAIVRERSCANRRELDGENRSIPAARPSCGRGHLDTGG